MILLFVNTAVCYAGFTMGGCKIVQFYTRYTKTTYLVVSLKHVDYIR